ncbi:Arf guanine nucleotide exchange factor sbh1 [Rhodosporidiobolus nylandii]
MSDSSRPSTPSNAAARIPGATGPQMRPPESACADWLLSHVLLCIPPCSDSPSRCHLSSSLPALPILRQPRTHDSSSRRAAALTTGKSADAPNSARAAGAGGSSSTMMRLYTDEAEGLKVDPVIVLSLAVVFIFSVVSLHLLSKLIRFFAK